MRFVQLGKSNPNILEIAWMWLPTFIGQNQQLLGEMDHVLNVRFPPPLEVDDETLEEIHYFVINYLCVKLKIPGLYHYLRGIESVGDEVQALTHELMMSIREALEGSTDWEALESGKEVPLGRTGMLIKKADNSRTLEEHCDKQAIKCVEEAIERCEKEEGEVTKSIKRDEGEVFGSGTDWEAMHRGERIVDERTGISVQKMSLKEAVKTVVNMRPEKEEGEVTKHFGGAIEEREDLRPEGKIGIIGDTKVTESVTGDDEGEL